MNPVAFELFGYPIRWYGIIIAGGVLVAFFISYILAKKKGLDFDIITDGFLWSFPFAIIGARLYYVAFEYKNYHSFIDVINIRNGGMAIHGGLIGGLLTAYIFTKVKKINFFEYIDVIMPGIILAQAIGRWGNYINIEAYGTETNLPLKMEIIENGITKYVHPTFLYESVGNFILFLILLKISKKRNFSGQITLLYFIGYAFIRFFIEGLRTDSLMMGNIRASQLLSLIIFIACTLIYIIFAKKQKNKQ